MLAGRFLLGGQDPAVHLLQSPNSLHGCHMPYTGALENLALLGKPLGKSYCGSHDKPADHERPSPALIGWNTPKIRPFQSLSFAHHLFAQFFKRDLLTIAVKNQAHGVA